MPLRTVLGIDHVNRIEVPAGALDARVIVMTDYDAAWWDEHVQKHIDDLPFVRADQGWIWPWILPTRRLAAGVVGQEPIAYVVEIRDRPGREFRPAVMIMLVDAYPHLPDHHLESVFVWYLSPAPRQYFEKELGVASSEIPDGKELMRIGMDVAITESYNRRLRGRVGLHADPKGGDKLVDWYESPVGGRMKRLPETSPLPPGMRSAIGRVKLIIRGNLRTRNDGRYFYHDESSAFSTSRAIDDYRPGAGA